jgi:hypothetical protein
MRNFAPSNKTTALVTRLGVLVIAAFFAAIFIMPTASMQEDSAPVQMHVQVADANAKGSGESKSRVSKEEAAKGIVQSQAAPPPFAPDAITGTTYVFSSAAAVALEDMSTGTTQLVAAGSDDGASPVTNIGFDFWYDGIRFTQFSCNANGLCRLGAAQVSTEFDNEDATFGFNTTTNAPKIAPYFDDIWTGTNGNVRTKVVGASPNRKLVVEWNNMTIPRPGAATVGAATFQMWLFEPNAVGSRGVIQFVYGTGMVANSVEGGYSIGLQSGAATNFASVTTTGPTVSYAAANNTQSTAIASGTSYLFTPVVPNAPSNNLVTGITANSLTLNWLDNAANEQGYVIYRSTDNVIFNFIAQTAANSTSFTDTGLSPSTNYFYTVQAVTEGALSTITSFGATTSPAGTDTCLGAGGNWDSPGTWTDGSVPTSADNVSIGSGCTVTVNVANAVALNVTIDSGGTLQSPAAGAVITNNLTVNGGVTNNGTLDFSTNGDTSAAILTFGTGVPNVTFGGTGATTDVRAITVAKGAQATVVELNPTNFTVRGVTTDVAGYLTLTSGTFKVSGTFTMANRTFTTPAYVIPALGGFWLNNPNYTVAGTATSTTSGNSGLLRLTQGVYTIGLTGADGFSAGATGATYIIEGGTLNANGRFDPQNGLTYTQSAGTVNVAVVGNSVGNFGSFEIFATASTFNMSAGTINLINGSTGAPKDDFVMRSQTRNITGGLVVFGATGAPAGSSYATPFGNTFTPNVTVNTGFTWSINAVRVLMAGTTLTNNGAITSTGAAQMDFLNAGPMTYGGTGTFGTLVAPFATVASNSLSQTTLNSPMVVNRVNLFLGGFTNSNQITLGNAGASTTVVQIGSTGLVTPGGSFDVSPVHNQGTGGEIVLYAFETAARTTGVEINPTRILTSMLVDNINTVTIAGGNLTLSSAAAAATMTSGRIITGANTLILSSGTATVTRTSGYVDGNFRKNYTAVGNKSFEVGTANSFSPMAINVTTLTTNPSTMTVRAVQGPQPVLNPATSLQRYWSITEGGAVTATLTGTYATDALDVVGTEANYRVIRVTGGTAVNFIEVCPAGPCVAEATNTITIAGVTEFSDWTAGEPVSPTAAPATISGRVTTTSGAPLAGVTMRLDGGRTAMTVTDANGNYRFANVPVEQFYTVTPFIVNYHFSPASRSYSLVSNQTEATFAGTREETSSGNVIDTPEYFVRQHYLDFLGREPDNDGLNFWSNQMRGCGNDYNCLERRTINVSAAYFLSIEFHKTGGLVHSLYQASYGRAPLYAEFMPDTALVGRDVIVNQADWEGQLARNTEEFLAAWVERGAFHAAYDNLTNEGYIDALIRNTGVTFTESERAGLGRGLSDGTLTRAQVLQRVAENGSFEAAQRNEMFVRMQYFGYLRRDPDDSGYHFWLNKLNEFEGNFERAEMVKAFLVSGEYRDRFRQH